MSKRKITLARSLPFILIVSGIIGVFCAFTLTQDKFKLLENPNTHLNCSINPIIACGNVVSSDQGSAFGFPNPFLGLAGFAAVITIGVAILAGGVFKRWFWLTIEGGLLFAVSFVHWLFFESVYRINALCLYCMAVWIITITSFWYVTLYNFDQGRLPLKSTRRKKIYSWIRRHHLDLLVLWLAILTGLILKHFWYYFGKHL